MVTAVPCPKSAATLTLVEHPNIHVLFGDYRDRGSRTCSGCSAGTSIKRGRDLLEVGVELTDVRDNTEIWGQHYSGKSTDIISLQQQIAGGADESEFASALEQGFRLAGWKGALTKGVDVRQAQHKTGHQSPYTIAMLYAYLKDKDQALRWLNTAYEERDPQMENLKTDFVLDPIRSDPRFAELVRKVGLPQ